MVLVLLWFTFAGGCATSAAVEGGGCRDTSAAERASVQLEADLARMLGYTDPETHLLARTVLRRTTELARIYRIQRPALWHNFLVNTGWRERGLCCHWTQDLMHAIEELELRHYRIVWGVSRHGTWREHNSIVVTAAGKPFAEGLLLDPWRNAGELYWTRVVEDEYPWQPHPGNQGAARIRCR